MEAALGTSRIETASRVGRRSASIHEVTADLSTKVKTRRGHHRAAHAISFFLCAIFVFGSFRFLWLSSGARSEQERQSGGSDDLQPPVMDEQLLTISQQTVRKWRRRTCKRWRAKDSFFNLDMLHEGAEAAIDLVAARWSKCDHSTEELGFYPAVWRAVRWWRVSGATKMAQRLGGQTVAGGQVRISRERVSR